MRRKHLQCGLIAIGLASLIVWANLGKAQPAPAVPASTGASQQIIERVPVQPSDNDTPLLSPDSGLPAANSKLSSNVAPAADPTQEVLRQQALPVTKSAKPVRLAPELIQIPESAIQPVSGTSGIIAPECNETNRPSNTSLQPASATQAAVTLEWIGPGEVKLGSTIVYTLVVRNTSKIPVQKVVVQVRAPSSLNVTATEPKAESTSGALLWDLGNMIPGQERRLAITLAVRQNGDIACQAWVTFTGSVVMKAHVCEPKLTMKVRAPVVAMIGEPANITIVVSNPGDHAADHVTIKAILDETLETSRGNKLSFDLGALAPGEARTVAIPFIAKAGGQHKFEALAETNDGLKSSDGVVVNVVEPRLELTVNGPKMRYLDKKAVYTLKVTNAGDAPASNIFVNEAVPAGFKFVQADNGGQLDDAASSVKWFVGELSPGESKEVKCELLAISAGEFTHRFTANASRGMKSAQDLKTVVEGLSAIVMELVDSEDPVEVGADTSYEIKVTNSGTKAEMDVKLVCTVPPQLKLKSVNAPLKYDVNGNDIVFHTLPRLASRESLSFKIVTTAQVKGDIRFRASLTTASLVEPVVKVEPTKIYAD